MNTSFLPLRVSVFLILDVLFFFLLRIDGTKKSGISSRSKLPITSISNPSVIIVSSFANAMSLAMISLISHKPQALLSSATGDLGLRNTAVLPILLTAYIAVSISGQLGMMIPIFLSLHILKR